MKINYISVINSGDGIFTMCSPEFPGCFQVLELLLRIFKPYQYFINLQHKPQTEGITMLNGVTSGMKATHTSMP
jgi:hypothetical protein